MIKVLLISGDGCASCASMFQIASNLASNHNWDYQYQEANEEIIKKYHIEAIPTTLLLLDDKIINSIKGYVPDEVLEIWAQYSIEKMEKNI